MLSLKDFLPTYEVRYSPPFGSTWVFQPDFAATKQFFPPPWQRCEQTYAEISGKCRKMSPLSTRCDLARQKPRCPGSEGLASCHIPSRYSFPLQYSGEDLGKATGKSVYCKGQVQEIGVLDDDLDATPTYTTILHTEFHTSVQVYNIIRPIPCSWQHGSVREAARPDKFLRDFSAAL